MAKKAITTTTAALIGAIVIIVILLGAVGWYATRPPIVALPERIG